MRLHRFFIEEKIGDKEEITISDPRLIHQWLRVFRYKQGVKLVLLDNSSHEYVAKIISIGKDEVLIRIEERRENKILPSREVHLYFSVVKNRNSFEWLLEKGTEIGVSDFHPIKSDRGEEKNISIERAKIIIRESCEQSGRGRMPILHDVKKLSDIFPVTDKSRMIAFHLSDESISWNDYCKKYFPADGEAVNIFIGPEGGWSEDEISLFKENKIPLVSLIEATLRAETAGLVASTLFLI